MTICKLRQLKQMSQTELARQMNLSKSAISMLEKGTRKPKLDTIKKLAEILQVSVEEIVECF